MPHIVDVRSANVRLPPKVRCFSRFGLPLRSRSERPQWSRTQIFTRSECADHYWLRLRRVKNPGEINSRIHGRPPLAIGCRRGRNLVFSPTDCDPSAQSNALGRRTPHESQPEGLGAAPSTPNATFVPSSISRPVGSRILERWDKANASCLSPSD